MAGRNDHEQQMNKPQYELLCFDLDGTLADTADEIAAAANLALASHGIAARPPAEVSLLIGAGSQQLMRQLLQRVFADAPALAATVNVDAVLGSMQTHFSATNGTTALPYPGVPQALARLRAAGIKLACVTNKETRHAHHVLHKTQLLPFFDLLVGGDTLPHKKPHASVLLHVLAHFNTCAARCAHVGDSAVDVQAARNAGVTAWAVPYGYNAGLPIASAGPDIVFDGIAQVADHVLGELC
jgi:phosphoglycolate phosphatase